MLKFSSGRKKQSFCALDVSFSPEFCLTRPLTDLSADGEQQLCKFAVVLALPPSDCQLVLAGTGAFRPGPPDEVLDKLRPSLYLSV